MEKDSIVSYLWFLNLDRRQADRQGYNENLVLYLNISTGPPIENYYN